jgi:hypothetical protein
MVKKLQPSAGMRKVLKKAEKITDVKRVGHGDGGEVSVATKHHSPQGPKKDSNRPVVEGLADTTGEIRTFPTKGKARNFNSNISKAESRATAFINASTEGKTYGGR